MREITYSVPGVSCDHCKIAIESEVSEIAGVRYVDVDVDSKIVRVGGTDLDDAAIRAAIEEAGYDAA